MIKSLKEKKNSTIFSQSGSVSAYSAFVVVIGWRTTFTVFANYVSSPGDVRHTCDNMHDNAI